MNFKLQNTMYLYQTKTLLFAAITGLIVLTLVACETTAPQATLVSSDSTTTASLYTPDIQKSQQLTKQAYKANEKNELAQAQKLLKKAIVAHPNNGQAHNNLGLIYYKQSQLALAKSSFEIAIENSPNQPEPINNLGLVYERLGLLEKAISQYQQARNLASENPIYLGNWLRANIRLNGLTPEFKPPLSTLAQIDDRPKWRHWATKQIAKLP